MDVEAVTVDFAQLQHGKGPLPMHVLEEAFGPSSLGILIVRNLPKRALELRSKLLFYSSYLAQLLQTELDAITDSASNYENGWSHGKEMLRDGHYDTFKGSFYVDTHEFWNPQADGTYAICQDCAKRNHWPSKELMPGFKTMYIELCAFIIELSKSVARSCDRYAAHYVEGYEQGYLERVVGTSKAHKSRLLHYFPLASQQVSQTPPSSNEEDDSWCAMHVDDGSLTALTSALFVDESEPLPPLREKGIKKPLMCRPPDSTAGLYIQSRSAKLQKVDIPADCLAFQTGKALELITNGRLKAVPHMVRGPKPGRKANTIARNTLAIFMQPDLDEVVDRGTGRTFGDLIASHNH